MSKAKPKSAPVRLHPATAPAAKDKPPKRQRVIPEALTHTWKFCNAETEAMWRAAGIEVEDDAIDLASEGVFPDDMLLQISIGPERMVALTTDYDALTLAQRYTSRDFAEASFIDTLPGEPVWRAIGNLLKAARKEALAFVCPTCNAKPEAACGEDGMVHKERVRLVYVVKEAQQPVALVRALPPELAVACPRCTGGGFEAGAVGQPCAETLDFQRGLNSADPGPCMARIIVARHGDAASIRRKWSLAAASVAEYLVDLGITAWETAETHGAQRLYLEALGLDDDPKQPEVWPGWAAVRAQLVPDTIVTGPLAEDEQVVLWPSQIDIVTDRKHPHLFCRRALQPPDADLIGQIEAYGGVREFVWITMCDAKGQLVREGGRPSMVDGRRRGAGVRAVNSRRITAALYDLRIKPRGEVEPPSLLTLQCRFTADPERVAVIKDTANHGRLAEDLLRQADGVANLAGGGDEVDETGEIKPGAKRRSCREIAKLMGLSTQTVANLLSLTLLDAEVRQALERGEFSVFCGYKLAKEDHNRQRLALAATAGLVPRERGPAIERFLSGEDESEARPSKSWKGKDVKGLAEKMAASRSAEVQQLGQVLAYLTGTGSLKGLPKAWQRALTAEASP